MTLFGVNGLENSQNCLSILMQRNRPAMVNFLYNIVEQIGNYTYESLHLEYLEQYVDIPFLSWLIWLFTPIIVSYQVCSYSLVIVMWIEEVCLYYCYSKWMILNKNENMLQHYFNSIVCFKIILTFSSYFQTFLC